MSRLFKLGDHRALLSPLNDQPYPSMIDDAWDDAIVSTAEAQGATSLTIVQLRDTNVNVFGLAPNDVLTIATQMPHRWNKGQVRPHIHVIPNVLPVAPRNVQIQVKYAWSYINQPVPADVNWITPAAIDTPIAIADAFVHKVILLGNIDPPAGAHESAILIMRLTRVAAGDTYNDGVAANLVILSIDTHFRAEKLGTSNEF